LSFTELFDIGVIKNSFRLNLFDSIAAYLRKNFKNPRLIQMLEFPVLFLGARPEQTPALYSLMNYADMILGTWYPRGGIHTVVDGLVSLATSLGVDFEYSSAVKQIKVNSVAAKGCVVKESFRHFDYVVASADYDMLNNGSFPPAIAFTQGPIGKIERWRLHR
jgi:phytoene desaturase